MTAPTPSVLISGKPAPSIEATAPAEANRLIRPGTRVMARPSSCTPLINLTQSRLIRVMAQRRDTGRPRAPTRLTGNRPTIITQSCNENGATIEHKSGLSIMAAMISDKGR